MSNQDNTKTTTTAAEAAAAWWAQQLGAPVFRNVDANSGPEDIALGSFAGGMAAMLADKHPVSDAQGEKFVAALVAKIGEISHRDWISLGVDYGPDLMLAEAATEAGIHTSRFPWKTHMSITRNYVTAALGYRARDRLIWASPDWQRPPCGQHKYDDEGYPLEANEMCTLPRFHDGDCGGWAVDSDRCVECGGSYVDHYGRDRGAWTHSWKTETGAS